MAMDATDDDLDPADEDWELHPCLFNCFTRCVNPWRVPEDVIILSDGERDDEDRPDDVPQELAEQACLLQLSC